MIKIIGISGLIGSGKDTVADYLVNYHEFRRESFAGTLKDAVSNIFGWDRTLLEGRTRESREWREQIDSWWAERLGIPKLTPRLVLQLFGTELCRQNFHSDIWIASLEHKLITTTDNIVISDVRFPNEIEAIRRAGGRLICIERGQKPDWYLDAVENMQLMPIYWPHVHHSEYSWINTRFDLIIENNDTVDNLYAKIKNLVVDY